MNVRRIFHPTDFSPSANVALTYALQMALRFDAELDVAHIVYGGREYWDAGASPTLEDVDLETRVRESVARGLARLPSEQAERLRPSYYVIRHETPAAGILRFAEQHASDVVVLGTHGRRGIRRFLLGSVALEVLHSARTDVVMVPSEFDEERGGRILVPVDLCARSEEVVEAAGELSRVFNTPLDLLHVLDLPQRLQLRTDSNLHPDVTTLRRVVQDRLDALTEGLAPKTVVTLHVESGRPAHTILTYVQDHAVRFVVMASAGMSPAERVRLHPAESDALDEIRWAIGRVTERVVTHSAIPVWIVKRFADRVPAVAEHYYMDTEVAD